MRLPFMLLVLSCPLFVRAALGLPENVRQQLAEMQHMSETLHAKMAATDKHVGTLLQSEMHGLEWAAEFVDRREEMLRREAYAAEESARRVQDLKHEVSARSKAGIPTANQFACQVTGRGPPARPHPPLLQIHFFFFWV